MKRWRAEDGKTYFFITYDMKVDSMTENDDGIDALAYNSGNYFETKAEAEEVAAQFRSILKQKHKDLELVTQ